jgi:DNA-binding NarL/FixJ family response regulator
VLAARALNNLVQGVPPASAGEHAEMLERMRGDAERAGFESLAVAAYFQGRARLAMRAGNLSEAIEALEEGRNHDRGYLRRGRRADYHAVFLGGLYLEAGRLDDIAKIIEDLSHLVLEEASTIPGLAFHLACRRGDLPLAQRLLDELYQSLADQAWRSGSQAHDLIAAALTAGLPLSKVDSMRVQLLDSYVWDDYRTLVDAQLDEAHARHHAALAGYVTTASSAILSPPVRGTAHVGAARCLLAADRAGEAAAHVEAAMALLGSWGGWRLAQLDQARARLGMAAPDAPSAVTGPAALTPREREVALLIADGLTNTDLARRLYISPKTAAVHVSSILRKLGVASRTEVGSVIEQP